MQCVELAKAQNNWNPYWMHNESNQTLKIPPFLNTSNNFKLGIACMHMRFKPFKHFKPEQGLKKAFTGALQQGNFGCALYTK